MRRVFAVANAKYFSQMRKIIRSCEVFVFASHCDGGSPAQMRIIFLKKFLGFRKKILRKHGEFRVQLRSNFHNFSPSAYRLKFERAVSAHFEIQQCLGLLLAHF